MAPEILNGYFEFQNELDCHLTQIEWTTVSKHNGTKAIISQGQSEVFFLSGKYNFCGVFPHNDYFVPFIVYTYFERFGHYL